MQAGLLAGQLAQLALFEPGLSLACPHVHVFRLLQRNGMSLLNLLKLHCVLFCEDIHNGFCFTVDSASLRGFCGGNRRCQRTAVLLRRAHALCCVIESELLQHLLRHSQPRICVDLQLVQLRRVF